MIMPKSDTVTITRDAWNDLQGYIKRLEGREAKLDALEAGGVDNWEGYDCCFEDAVSELFTKEDDL